MNDSFVVAAATRISCALRLRSVADIIWRAVSARWLCLPALFSALAILGFFLPVREMAGIPALVLVAAFALICCVRNERHAPVLFSLAIAALMLHLIISGAASFSSQSFPDEDFYDHFARQKAQEWLGGPSLSFQGFMIERANYGMIYVYALGKLLFGTSMFASRMFSFLIVLLLAIAIYAITREIFGPKEGVFAYAAVLLTPSSLIWGSLVLKEALALLLAAIGLLCICRFAAGRSAAWLLPAMGMVALLLVVRFYFGFFLVAAAALAIGRRILGAKIWVLLGALFFATLVALAEDLLSGGTALASLLEIVDYRRSVLAFGDAAYLQSADLSSLGGFLLFLPFGMAYALAAPFPWQFTSVRWLALLPDMFVLHVSIALAVFGIVRSRSRWAVAEPILVFCLLSLLLFSVFEANLGTLVRHRLSFSLLLLVFAAGGLFWLLERPIREVR